MGGVGRLRGKWFQSHCGWMLGSKSVRAHDSTRRVMRGGGGERKTTLHRTLTSHHFVGAGRTISIGSLAKKIGQQGNDCASRYIGRDGSH